MLNPQQFGDYTMSYRPPEMGDPYHQITAHHPTARTPGWATPFNARDPSMVGRLRWDTRIHRVDDVSVDPAHRRQGLATAMWNMGQGIKPRPIHSSDRTDMGDSWAKSVGGKLPRRVQDLDK